MLIGFSFFILLLWDMFIYFVKLKSEHVFHASKTAHCVGLTLKRLKQIQLFRMLSIASLKVMLESSDLTLILTKRKMKQVKIKK